MKTMHAEPLFKVKNGLGEGPLWHPIENRLYWVDIEAGDLYRSDPSMTSFTKTHFDTSLGAFGFVETGAFILASGIGFAHWHEGDDALKVLWHPTADRPDVRLNDGKVDSAGRFWAGTIDMSKKLGHLYRLDPDGTQHTLLDRVGISNGLGWSPDGQKMYYTDSYRYSIFVFDYDLKSGAITNRRTFVRLPKTSREIVPDGLCVDANGYVWSAHWNGSSVVQYDPLGRAVMTIKVPARRVTSCCFGGKNLDMLFITTARAGLADEILAEQPNTGDVFVCPVNTPGQPANFFRSEN